MKRVMKLLVLLLILKRVYSRSVVFFVNAVNRNTTSLSLIRRRAARVNTFKSGVIMRKNLSSLLHENT